MLYTMHVTYVIHMYTYTYVRACSRTYFFPVAYVIAAVSFALSTTDIDSFLQYIQIIDKLCVENGEKVTIFSK